MKSIKKKIVAVTCSAVIIGSMAITTTVMNNSKAENYTAVCSVENEYAFGSTITVPEGKIRIGEREVDAQDTYLSFPNGKLEKGNSFELNEIGEYAIVYTAVDQGKTVQAKKTFNVYQNAYTVSSEKSNVQYVEDLETTKAENDGGMKVTLAEGDTFTYNKVIDLTGATKNDQFITFAPYSMSCRVVKNRQTDKTTPIDDPYPLEARYTVIRLTDYYDSENYVEISLGFYVMNQGTGRLAPCIVVGANGQMKAGLYPGSKASGSRRLVTVDGSQYVAYYGTNDYGAQLDTGMCGFDLTEYRNDGDFGLGKTYVDADGNTQTVSWPRQSNLLADIYNADDYGYGFSYDEETKRIYGMGKTNHLIVDLDDESIFDQNLFKGFTTGEVIISVSQSEYKQATATFEILNIGGESGVALNKDKLIDEDAPVIEIASAVEECTIAKGEEFEIFSAKAKDVNLTGKVKAFVYYEYGTENQSSVSLTNGKFTPIREGDYTIVYQAKDVYGNVAEKSILCHARTLPNNRRVDFQTVKLESVKAGEVAVLNEYELTTFDGGAFVKIYAVFDGDEKTKIEINPETREFMPRNIGKYEIVYEYGDAVKSYTWSYELESTTSDNAYVDKLGLPNYLIAGATYTFERVLVETYADKLEYVLPTVYADEDGKGYAEPVDLENYTVSAKTNVKFKYVYNGKILAESKLLSVVEVGYNDDLKMQNYFVGNVEKSASLECVSLSTTENASAEFISVLSFNKFSMQFAVPTTKNKFDAVKITLTDLYDENNSLQFTYTKDIKGCLFSVNDGEKTLKTTAFAGIKRTIEYNAALGAFTDTDGNLYYTANPFATDKILVKVEFVGVSGNAGIDVYSISNQLLSNKVSESVPPMIIYANNVGGVRSVGDKIVFRPVTLIDVLTPFCMADYSFRVIGPDGKTVVSDEGVSLDNPSIYDDYSLTLTNYGRYTVKYTYRDGFGKPLSETININVSDREAPVITLNDGYTENTVWQVSKGAKAEIQGYTVSDNLSKTEDVDVRIYVVSPENELILIDVNDTTFTADKKGDYKVVYFVTDEEGNVASAYYTVRVK